MTTIDVDTAASRRLARQEREIADRFMGGVPWGAVAWGFGNLAFWLSLWPMVLTGFMPLWLAFPLATVSVALSYLPSHEAQHHIIARPGERLFWLNELLGHLSTLPLVMPYRMARLTHMEHHAHANHPELDPDSGNKSKSGWDFLKNYHAIRQPGSYASGAYGRCLARIGTPEAKRAALETGLYQLTYLTLLFAISWSGHALEAALLWWLPKYLAMTYIGFYLSWAPHHPGNETGRYRDTRGFKSRVGNILSMGMQFHVIHHLYPRIPLMRTPKAFWALRPVLVERGVELGGL